MQAKIKIKRPAKTECEGESVGTRNSRGVARVFICISNTYICICKYILYKAIFLTILLLACFITTYSYPLSVGGFMSTHNFVRINNMK